MRVFMMLIRSHKVEGSPHLRPRRVVFYLGKKIHSWLARTVWRQCRQHRMSESPTLQSKIALLARVCYHLVSPAFPCFKFLFVCIQTVVFSFCLVPKIVKNAKVILPLNWQWLVDSVKRAVHATFYSNRYIPSKIHLGSIELDSQKWTPNFNSYNIYVIL